MFGGIIAGALGQGAQATGEVAQQTIDVNNKMQLASFQSGLEADRNAQAQRLAQTIGQENVMHGLSPEVTSAQDAAAASRQRSTALTAAAPDVLAATNAAEASKPREIPFGGEFHQNINGVDTIIGKNKTPIEDFRYPRGGAGSAADKKDLFDLKDAHAGLTETTGDVEKLFKDPVTQTAPPALASFATSSYQQNLRAPGGNPIDARVAAVRDASTLYANAKLIMQSEKYKDQVKGDINAALVIAQQLAAPAAPAQPKPATDSAVAPAPPKAPTATMGTPKGGLIDASMNDDTPIPSLTAGRSQTAIAAKRGARVAAAPVSEAQKSTEAQAAYAALKPNDARAASDLQGSDLFDFLSKEQKAQISSLVNRGY